MRKFLVLLLAAALCLTACGSGSRELVNHTFEDLSIDIPADFINLSDEAYGQGLDFIFGLDPIAINGLREEKATFAAYGLDLDLQRYGQLLLNANNVSGTLEEKDNILTFSYESSGFTYVVTLWETEKAFWTVQAYCQTEDYAKAKGEIWDILSSVTV